MEQMRARFHPNGIQTQAWFCAMLWTSKKATKQNKIQIKMNPMEHSESFHTIWAFVWNRDPIESANQKTEKFKFKFEKKRAELTIARILMNKRVCAHSVSIYFSFFQAHCEWKSWTPDLNSSTELFCQTLF